MGFEPTRGDPIGLAGRRLSRSAKVSLKLSEYRVCSSLKSKAPNTHTTYKCLRISNADINLICHFSAFFIFLGIDNTGLHIGKGCGPSPRAPGDGPNFRPRALGDCRSASSVGNNAKFKPRASYFAKAKQHQVQSRHSPNTFTGKRKKTPSTIRYSTLAIRPHYSHNIPPTHPQYPFPNTPPQYYPSTSPAPPTIFHRTPTAQRRPLLPKYSNSTPRILPRTIHQYLPSTPKGTQAIFLVMLH